MFSRVRVPEEKLNRPQMARLLVNLRPFVRRIECVLGGAFQPGAFERV